MLSWDDAEDETTVDQEAEKDFLLNAEGGEAKPMACPLNPDGLEGCEACS